MNRIPYGYKLINGQIAVNEAEAEKIRTLFTAHFNGMSTVDAGRAAGLDLNPKQLRYILRNPIYIGDKAYPAIVDREMLVVARKNKKRAITKQIRISPSFSYSDIPDVDPSMNPADYVTILYDRLVPGTSDDSLPAEEKTVAATAAAEKTVTTTANEEHTARPRTVSLAEAMAAWNEMRVPAANACPAAMDCPPPKHYPAPVADDKPIPASNDLVASYTASGQVNAHTGRHRPASNVVSLSF